MDVVTRGRVFLSWIMRLTVANGGRQVEERMYGHCSGISARDVARIEMYAVDGLAGGETHGTQYRKGHRSGN
jgi:hypothetical protein